MRLQWGFSALLLAACSPEQEAAVADRLLPDQASLSEARATGILNAGVMAELGSAVPVKFLFDPLYDDHFGTLEPLDDALIDRIVTGAPPYDGVSAIFVSHAHPDHFSARMFNRLMAAQTEMRLVAPRQAVEKMRSEDGWDPVFAARITEISLENGEQAEPFEIAGARIEAFRSPHSGWPDRHANVHNITFRVAATAAPGMAHRVMHFGDADPGAEHYGAHGEFLSSARTGLAIVPYWHLGVDDPKALIAGQFNAEAAVGMHVPVSAPGWLEQSGWRYFSGEGQVVEVPEVQQ